MLVLSRRENEVIYIGEDIKIMVVGFETHAGQPPKVRIGIEAPTHIQIVREEIRLRFDNKGNKIDAQAREGE